MYSLRPELTELPERMRFLPVEERGYPVPWFVLWIDGKPEFRAMDAEKWKRAVRDLLCWVCGQKLGSTLYFVLGPMCTITRTTTEPPCHRDCARWSALNCPFLVRPHARRREDERTAEAESIGGIPLLRNPGVAALWVTRSYTTWRPVPGEILIRVGSPERVEWYAEGRAATRAEVMASVQSGLPFLEAQCDLEPVRYRNQARKDLYAKANAAEALWPAA